MEPADDWITVQEAARLSGYSQQYLRRLIRNNRLDARKFGTIWQVSKTALLMYLAEVVDKRDQRWGPKPIDSNPPD